jgi:undecaprenyl-diphosphatase
MFGASLLKIIKFMRSGIAMSTTEGIYIVIGMTVAFAVSLAAIRFLLGYIRKHDFTIFGKYRIGLGIVVLLFFTIQSIF